MDLNQKIWTIYAKYQRDGLYNSDKKRSTLRNRRKNTKRYFEVREALYDLYHNKEYGIKLLGKKFGLSYTKMRSLLSFLEIDLRKGRNVVTTRLKTLRKEKALYEGKHKTGWNSPEINRKYKRHNRGVQGFYFNKSMQKYVWLRSTWEYIYAKWLDKINEVWDVEVKYYNINGLIYRPDFFIYEGEQLRKIVEIKGYWDSNINKASILNEELRDIDVIIIYNIEKYIEKNSSYHKELERWKREKKQESEING